MADVLPFSGRRPPSADGGDALSALALADHAGTLDPSHPVNVALSDLGAGRVPTVLRLDVRRRVATLSSLTLRARVDVPLGWHAIEDALHLALFDPPRQVQAQIGVLHAADRCPAALLDDIEREAAGAFPANDALRLRDGGRHLLALRRSFGGRIPQEEYHLIAPGPHGDTVIHVRAVAAAMRGAQAAVFVQALHGALDFGVQAEPR